MEKRRSWLWGLLILALILGLIWQFYPLPNAAQRFEHLPLFDKGFAGRNIPLNEFEKNFFKNVTVMKRLYTVGDQRLFITALDGTRNRHVVHDPYYCFRGGGWEIMSEEAVTLPKGEAKLLTLTREEKTQPALYWFSDGSTQYTSPMKYWWQATLRRLSLGASGPEPVLIIVQPIDGQELDWKALFKTFPELLAL